MNILIDIGHPAQVYNFKYIYQGLIKKGHKVYIIAIDKDITIDLLEKFEMPYVKLKNTKKSLLLKLIWILLSNIKAFHFIYNKKIDVVVSRMSIYMTIPAWVLRRKHIGLCDTESAIENKVISKMLTFVLSSDSFKPNLGSNHYKIKSNIELFYLHPNHFKIDEQNNCFLNIESDVPYVIMRFVSWDAFHDKGLTGFSDTNKLKAVECFSKYARVFISSEKSLPDFLQQYQIRIPPERMHDVLAKSLLFFGESATMASESACLGVPAVYLDKNGRGYIDEEVQFGLVYHYRNSDNEQKEAINKGVEILSKKINSKTTFEENKKAFLKNKIDASSLLVGVIENIFNHDYTVDLIIKVNN